MNCICTYLTCALCIQEVKAKPGDLRPKMLENMALIASKQKQNVEKAVNNLMEVSANEVRVLSQVVCWWGVLFCERYWCHCLKYFDYNVFQLMKRGAKKKNIWKIFECVKCVHIGHWNEIQLFQKNKIAIKGVSSHLKLITISAYFT